MSSTRFPIYKIQGNHYEFGRKLGELAKDAIVRRLKNDENYFQRLFDFIQSESGEKLNKSLIDATRSYFPWYFDEIRGLADGSEIPLEKIVVLNFLNEIRTAFKLEKEENSNQTGEKGCTTVLLNRKKANLRSIIHNEDHSKALYDASLFVQAEIYSTFYDNEKRQSPQEKFFAFCYAGAIPGNAFSMNFHGFVCTLNGLYPNFVGEGRLPRQIVNRALLSVANEEELDILVKTSPVAYGFGINVGFCHDQKYLFNYEIGPNMKIDGENYISKCRVVNEEEKHPDDDNVSIRLNYLVHYNHYERLNNLITEQKSLDSSHHRWNRGQELGEITDIDSALTLLSDSKDKEFPIFRGLNAIEVSSCTLCTVHFDFSASQLTIYEENPKESQHPSLILKFSQLFE